MDYQTLLVHVDGSVNAAARIAYACRLATRCAAQLIGAAPTGISRFLYHNLPPEQDDPTLALHLDMMRDQARTALGAFDAACERAALGTWQARLIDDEGGAGLALHGRAADLLIVSQPEPDRPAVADLPAYVITHSGRPVLVLPPAPPSGPVERILVAWDGGREAARALQLALPLLRQARHVGIALVDAPAAAQALAEAMLADPRDWLGRHGIAATLATHTIEHRHLLGRRNEVGERLLALAETDGADLLVMGAFGHSRFREAVLGGVTRTVMDGAKLPLLMAH